MGLFGADKCEGCGVQDKTVTQHFTHRKLCPRCAAAENARIEQHQARLAQVLISTGDVRREYEIVEVIMSLEAAPRWDAAWSKVLTGLRSDAVKLGCDGVIWLQVEHRVYVENKSGFFGDRIIQGVEFFACGTAIRYRRS